MISLINKFEYFLIDKISKYIGRSELKKRFSVGFLWSFVQNILQKFSSLFMYVILARILGKIVFGEFSVIQYTLVIFGMLLGNSLNQVGIRYISMFYRNKKEELGEIIGNLIVITSALIIICSALSYIFSPYIAKYLLNSEDLAYYLRISIFILAIGLFNSFFYGLLLGLERFRDNSIISTLMNLLSLMFAILLSIKYSLTGAIIGIILSYFVTLIIYYFYFKRMCIKESILIKYSVKYLNEILSFQISSTLISILGGPVTWISVAIILHTSNGYAEIGLFNSASQWRNLVLFFPAIFSSVMKPIISSRGKDISRDFPTSFVKKISIANLFLISLISLIIILASKSIEKIYGNQFEGLSIVIVLNVIIGLISGLIYPFESVLLMGGHIEKVVIVNSFWAGSLIFFTYLFKELGATGLSIANIIAYCIMGVLITFFISKIYKEANK